jgi:hypothetical protein
VTGLLEATVSRWPGACRCSTRPRLGSARLARSRTRQWLGLTASAILHICTGTHVGLQVRVHSAIGCHVVLARPATVAGHLLREQIIASRRIMAIGRWHGTGHSPHDNGRGTMNHSPSPPIASPKRARSLANPSGNLANTSSPPGNSPPPKIPHPRPEPGEDGRLTRDTIKASRTRSQRGRSPRALTALTPRPSRCPPAGLRAAGTARSTRPESRGSDTMPDRG